MGRNKAALILITLFLCWTASGCLESRELKERTVIEAVGIDQMEDRFRVTLQRFITPENASTIVTSEGRSISEAIDRFTHSHGGEVFLGNSAFVVIGKETARQGISRELNFFNTENAIAPTIYMVVSDTTAEDILRVQTKDEEKYPVRINEIMDQGKKSGVVGKATLMDVMKRLYSDGSSPYMPVVRKEKNASGKEEIQVSGTAVFQDDDLKDFLNTDETKGILWATDEIDRALIVVKNQDLGTVAAEIQNSRTRISTDIVHGVPHFTLKTDCSAMLREVMRSEGGGISGSQLETAQKLIESEIQRLMEKSIEKAFLKDRCDIFRFSDFIKKDHPAYWKSVRDSWPHIMPDCTFQYEVWCTIAASGQESVYRAESGSKKP